MKYRLVKIKTLHGDRFLIEGRFWLGKWSSLNVPISQQGIYADFDYAKTAVLNLRNPAKVKKEVIEV